MDDFTQQAGLAGNFTGRDIERAIDANDEDSVTAWKEPSDPWKQPSDPTPSAGGELDDANATGGEGE
jgi:hypothetical protein